MASLGSLALPHTVAASRSARVLTRERFASVLLPMMIVTLLGILHQAQVFRDIDGRIFDRFAVVGSATIPTVVVVERDPRFAAMGADRFDALDRVLARSGIERIGYLGARDTPGPGRACRDRAEAPTECPRDAGGSIPHPMAPSLAQFERLPILHPPNTDPA